MRARLSHLQDDPERRYPVPGVMSYGDGGKVTNRRFPTALTSARTELVRFCVVSILGIVLDVSLAWALSRFGDVPLTGAATISFAVAALLNYVLHESWTFSGERRSSLSRSILYLVSLVATLLTRIGVIALLQRLFTLGPEDEFCTLVPAIAASFCVNYLVSKFVVFRKSRHIRE